ncbi:hypothetical protein ACFP1Z_02605 [Streptomyces gamaensis]|uniref:Uncharacterized protein n=1 Tax=Streptomyces gamaensis TaxID=1763542 RepID=A0ABW0YUZ8_9ACTN
METEASLTASIPDAAADATKTPVAPSPAPFAGLDALEEATDELLALEAESVLAEALLDGNGTGPGLATLAELMADLFGTAAPDPGHTGHP